MRTLGDAWAWYQSARAGLGNLRRIGRKYWADLPAGASLWRDDQFRDLSASDVEDGAARALEPLDDLAVLVLFSVFEAVVRDTLERDVRASAAGIAHPVLTHAAGEAIRGIQQHSFATNVLEPLKRQMGPDWSNKSTRSASTGTGSATGGGRTDRRA